jgi:hypothetical protein
MATNILETRIIATDEDAAKLALIVDQFGRSATQMQAAAARYAARSNLGRKCHRTAHVRPLEGAC